MTFSSPTRKFILFAHVTTSVGLLGAVASFLLLSTIGIVSSNEQLVRACYVLLMPLTTYLVLPLVIASLFVGIISSLGTPWGLIRYYWVAAKLLLTSVILIVLLLQMNAIAELSAIAAARMVTDAELDLRIRMIVHSGGGLGLLLLIMILSLWKPKGVTPFGQRQSTA
jgi:hypothetical protein